MEDSDKDHRSRKGSAATRARDYYRVLGWCVVPAWTAYRSDRGLATCECRDGVRCLKPGKHPIGLWGEFEPSMTALRARWLEAPTRRVNFSLLLGRRSGIAVADLDNKPNKYARTVEERLARLAVAGWSLDTCIERSGGGGLHVYAALPAGVRIASQPTYLEPGIELLAEGRQAIIAPSKNADVKPYEWLDGHDPWTLRPAALPAEVLAGLPEHHRAEEEPREPLVLDEKQLAGLARRAPDFLARAVARARAGDTSGNGRNNVGLWLACQLRDLRLSKEEARPYMLEYQRRVK